MVVPIAARYEELARAMTLAFTDGKLFFSSTYKELYLSNPEVYASASDQLVVKLHLAGPITAGSLSANLDGDLYFAGHPEVVDNELRIPDLEPTVDTSSFLLGLKASLDRDGIRNQARAALKLDLGERFAAVREKLSKDIALDGNLGCMRADVALARIDQARNLRNQRCACHGEGRVFAVQSESSGRATKFANAIRRPA